MTANEWFWTGHNNAVDGHNFPPRVSLFKRAAYRVGWFVGALRR
jgi:hypothetical protein